MIKSGDKIGFKRTMYGVQEFGTYVGKEKSEKSTTKWGNKLHVVRLEDGECVKFNYDGVNGSDAICNMKHHVGWLTTTKEFVHCDRGYACAAWFENILVKKGERFPLFAEVDRNYSDKFNKYFEGGIRRVWTILSGTVTTDDFGIRFCGNSIGVYDEKKNAGKSSTHHVSWYGYQFGSLVLAIRGTPNYSNEHYEFDYEVELFDNIEIVPTIVSGDTDGIGSRKIYSSNVSLKRFFSNSTVVGILEKLEKEKLYPNVSKSFDDESIHVLVENGDWSREHLRVEFLVKEYLSSLGYNVNIVQNVIPNGKPASDIYSAAHVFSEVQK